MITLLKGTIFSHNSDSIILFVNGVGYRVYVMNVASFILDKEYTLNIHQHFQENAQSLYGFNTSEELVIFEQLILVNGIGVITALNILNMCSYQQLINAILDEDVNYLMTLPKIGEKSALQIIKSLKGKDNIAHVSIDKQANTMIDDVIEALLALGYKRGDVLPIQASLIKEQSMSSTQYMRLALDLLANK